MYLHIAPRLVLTSGLIAGWTGQVTSRRLRGSCQDEDLGIDGVKGESASVGRLLRRLLQVRRVLQASVLALCMVALGSVAAHAQSYTYVTNTDDDTVSLIYTATHEIKNPPVRAIISLRKSGDNRHYNPVATAVTPYNVAGNANGQFIYTVNKDVNSVSVIGTAKSQLVTTIDLGAGATPVNIAISGVRLNPDGGQCRPGNTLWRTYAYVTNSGNNTVSIIDTDPKSPKWNTVVGTINVGKGPSAVAVSRPTLEQTANGTMFFSAGFYVYVTNGGDNTVSVIGADYRSGPNGCGSDAPSDLNFHRIITSPLPVGVNPTAISFDRYGRWAYVVNTASSNVSAIDACAGAPPDQGTCQDVFAPNYKVARATIPVGSKPAGVAITIDFTGSHKHQQFRAYVTNPGDDSFSVLDVEAGSPNFQKNIFTCKDSPGDPNCPKPGDKPTGVSVMYPDEDFVYITNYGSNSVLVIDSDPDSLGGPGGVKQYNHVVGRIKRGIGTPFPGAKNGKNCQPPGENQRWCGRPLGISNTPRVPYAYVMNSGTNTISVVGASPQIGDPHPILHTIPLTFSPSWVTLNRNQDFIFVADRAGGKVHVINTMGQVEVGSTDPKLENMGHPLRLATPPDGWSAYVTSDNGNVYAVDTVDRSGPGGPGDPFVGGGGQDVSFPIPGTPNFKPMLVHLRRCSTGDSMVCANPRSPVILSVGKDLGGLDVHPDNFYGIVASKGTNQLVIVDTHYDRETWNQVVGFVQGLPPGSNPNAVAFSHVGDRAYSLNSNGTVSKIDTSGGIDTWKVLSTIAVGKDPKAMAFSEADLHAYVTNSGDGTVSVIRLSDFTPVATVKVGDNPQDIFINLGERVAAYVVNTGSDTISIIDDQPQNPTFNKVLDTVKLPPGSKPIGIILTEP